MQQTINGTSNGTLISSPLLNFSPFTFGYTTTASLPVKLTSFNGRATTQGAALTWLVASEENFSHYEVQKSNDQRRFETIGRVNGQNRKQYDFLDENATGTNYYRLKMVDKDGTSSYSKTVRVDIASLAKKGWEATVVSNALPEASPSLLLRITSEKDALIQVRIADQMGRLMMHQSLRVAKGNGVYALPSSFAGKGVFYIQFFDGEGNHHTEKLMRY